MPALQASFLYEYVYFPDQALKAVNTGGEQEKTVQKVTFLCPLN